LQTRRSPRGRGTMRATGCRCPATRLRRRQVMAELELPNERRAERSADAASAGPGSAAGIRSVASALQRRQRCGRAEGARPPS
jgi:hypothetical protein